MLSKYQNFIDKYGKIIFPLFLLFLFVMFIAPPTYCISTINPADQYAHISKGIASNFTKSLVGFFYTTLIAPIKVYAEFSTSTFVISICCCGLSLVALFSAFLFLIIFFMQSKKITCLLVFVPLCYIGETLILSFTYSAKPYLYIPFLPFYFSIVALIFLVLYSIKIKSPSESD